MNIDSLVLEVTRRCSCACDHCLRGEAQNLDMSASLLPSIFKGINFVHTITFSGGEPSLNIPFIQETLIFCKEQGIYVDSIFIATNGLQNQKELIVVMDEWLEYCVSLTMKDPTDPIERWVARQEYLEESLFSVACSVDQFHPEIDKRMFQLLSKIPYYSKNKEVRYAMFSGERGVSLLKTGNADFYGFDGRGPDPLTKFDIVVNAELYA